jgi:hypothetical protein
VNEIINELKAERDALRHRLAKIEAAIEEYERWAESVAGLVGTDSLRTGAETQSSVAAEQTPIAEFERAVLALFARAEKPLRRTEVHDALVDEGIVVGGKDPLNTVASRLSRMEGVTNLKGHGYWAADRPYPPAGYQVDDATALTPTETTEAPSGGDFFPETAKDTGNAS